MRLKFVQSVWKDMVARGGVEKALLPHMQISQANANFVRAELTVDNAHLNRLGSVHGGVVSTLVDVGGSLALASRGMFMTGVTTDMSSTFMSHVGKPGDRLRIDCHLDKMGRTMAFTFVQVYRLAGDEYQLVARGSHTKYISSALKSDRNVTFEDS